MRLIKIMPAGLFSAPLFLAPLCLAAFPAIPAAQAQPAAADMQLSGSPESPVLTLAITGMAQGQPDRAIISSGVSASAPLARDAILMNARKMKSLFAALKKIGVARNQIQTSRLSLVRQYERNPMPGEARIPVGYTARNDISVRLKEVEDTGGAIDALAAAGADRINGPVFTLNDDSKLVQMAREDAMKQARQVSSFYASATGYRQAQIAEISESVNFYGPESAANVMVASDGRSSGSPTPVEVGEIQRSVRMTIKYRLMR